MGASVWKSKSEDEAKDTYFLQKAGKQDHTSTRGHTQTQPPCWEWLGVLLWTIDRVNKGPQRRPTTRARSLSPCSLHHLYLDSHSHFFFSFTPFCLVYTFSSFGAASFLCQTRPLFLPDFPNYFICHIFPSFLHKPLIFFLFLVVSLPPPHIYFVSFVTLLSFVKWADGLSWQRLTRWSAMENWNPSCQFRISVTHFTRLKIALPNVLSDTNKHVHHIGLATHNHNPHMRML